MAETARSFSLATGDTVEDRLADADEKINARIKGLENEAREAQARQSARRAEVESINEQIHDFSIRITAAEKEVEKSGPYRKEVRELDPKTGEETIRHENLPYLENLERGLAKLGATRRELFNKKTRRVWIDQVHDDLSVAAPRPLRAAEPLIWQPGEGENVGEGYKRAFLTLSALVKEEDRIWNAPRPVAESLASVLAEIDATAKPPEFGGHRRGHVITYRGRQVATPDKKIAWPRVQVGVEVEADDSIGVIAWLLNDQLKAAMRKHILATYSDEGAISEADKPAMLADIGKQIWHQRRVVEAAYLYARARGITNLNRPKGTPTEILLDVMPWNKNLAITVADIAAPINGDDASAIPSEDFDFESVNDFESDADEGDAK